MKLYFIASDVEPPLDLFVCAADPVAAVAHWAVYYEGWDKPSSVTVYDVPGTGAPGAVPWCNIRRYRHEGGNT